MKLTKHLKGTKDVVKEAEERAAIMANPHVNFSERGAFKTKKQKPGQNTKYGAMPDIFKMQRSIVTSDQQSRVLVYNQSREWQGELNWQPEMAELFGDEVKIYVMAIPSDQGQLQLLKRVVGPEW